MHSSSRVYTSGLGRVHVLMLVTRHTAAEVKRGTTAGRPQALLGAGSGVRGRSSSSSPESKGPKESARPSAGTEDEGEGAFDLIFSQLEILRVLQIVMR